MTSFLFFRFPPNCLKKKIEMWKSGKGKDTNLPPQEIERGQR